MNRPLLWITLCFAAGIALSANLNIPVLMVSILTVSGFAAGLILYKYRINCTCILLLLMMLLGMMGYMVRMDYSLSRMHKFQDKYIYASGTIVSRPLIEENNRIAFDMEVREVFANNETVKVNEKIRVNNYIRYDRSERDLKYGDYVQVYGKLIKPEGQRNPGGFDYEKYLKAAGIYSIMAVYADNVNYLGRGKANMLMNLSSRTADAFEKRIHSTFNSDRAAMLCAMLFGSRHMLSSRTQASFRDSGAAHVLAVSGLHVGFIVLILFFLLNKLKINSTYSFFILSAILIIYIFITGCSPSVIRASIMACTIMLAKALKRNPDIITSISAAALIILIINPADLFNIGFQLSFAATLSIVLFFPGLKALFKRLPKKMADLLAVSAAAQLGIMPLTAYYFYNISIISVISNLLIVPVTGIIVILGFILCTAGFVLPLLWGIISVPLNLLLDLMNIGVNLLASIPFASVKIIAPRGIQIILYYTALLTLFGHFKFKLRGKTAALITACIIVALFTADLIGSAGNNGLRVTFLDVGQGDAIFIQTPGNHNILIDGGYASDQDSGFDAGEDIIIPFLLKNRIRKLDFVIISHIHRDHIGGLISVTKSLKVDRILSASSKFSNRDYNTLLKIAEDRGIPVIDVKKGDRVEFKDGTLLEVIHPAENILRNTRCDLNNNSMVIRLSYCGLRILFTGDIEQEAMGHILGRNEDIQAHVLKVPHHGSWFSYTDQFLEGVNPHIGVIQAGKDNSHGHPHELVVVKYQQKGIELYRTDKNGAVILEYDGTLLEITTMK